MHTVTLVLLKGVSQSSETQWKGHMPILYKVCDSAACADCTGLGRCGRREILGHFCHGALGSFKPLGNVRRFQPGCQSG